MAPRKLLLGITALFLAMLACSGGKAGPNVQQTVDVAVQATQRALGGDASTESPGLPDSTPFVSTPTNNVQPTEAVSIQSPCGVNDWRIIAVLKEEQPSSPGLKKVYVQFAVHNGSPIWGQLDLYRAMTDPPTATTEGGFTYPGKLESGGSWSGGALVLTPQSVPSGQTMYRGAAAENAEQGAAIFFSFEVAETQKKLLITFPAVTVLCYESSDKIVEDTTSMQVDVDKDVSQLPDIAKEFDSLPNMTDGIEVTEVGRFDLVSATTEPERTSDTQYLTVRLKFTNASSGYKTSGGISTFLFGDKGEMYRSMLVVPQFEAGPGLSSEVEIKYILFSGSQSQKYALAIEQVVTEPDYKTILVYQALKLPPSPATSSATQTGPDTNSLCNNNYFSVVKGAERVYKFATDSQNGNSASYQLSKITEVQSDGFAELIQDSQTQDFTNVNNSDSHTLNWSCLPEGLTSQPGIIQIPKDMNVGSSWTREIGTCTVVGVESVTVAAGTFDAVKVKVEPAYQQDQDYFIWFAPKVGIVRLAPVQDNTAGLFELISYSIPAP